MRKRDPRQLATAFEGSQSSKGFRLDDAEQLKDFAAYARARGAVVCNVETFEVRGEDEITRVDLSVFLGGVDDQAMPAVERIALSEEALQDLLTAIELEGIGCVFQVWTDELEDPL